MYVPSTQKQIYGFIAWTLVSFTASAVGAVASIHAKNFYAQLVQPTWAPPAGVFGPVWTTLFAMMSIAAWLVWRSGGVRKNRVAIMIFLTQLSFNALWSWIFFAWHLGALALIEVIALWILILATIVSFWRVSPLAGILLVPYLLWVSFATALTYSLWQLNPHILG